MLTKVCDGSSASFWGSRKLAALKSRMRAKKPSLGQRCLWDEWQGPADAVRQVARTFVLANCFNPEFVEHRFWDGSNDPDTSKSHTPEPLDDS